MSTAHDLQKSSTVCSSLIISMLTSRVHIYQLLFIFDSSAHYNTSIDVIINSLVVEVVVLISLKAFNSPDHAFTSPLFKCFIVATS